jgi:hypothetical protein
MGQRLKSSRAPISDVPLNRFYQLEREYRVLLAQIAKTMSAADLAQLKKHRTEIVVEAREIVRGLNAPNPRSCGRNS